MKKLMRVALIMLALLSIPLSVRADEPANVSYVQRLVNQATSWWEMMKEKVAVALAPARGEKAAVNTTAPIPAPKQSTEKTPEKSESPKKSDSNKNPVVASTGFQMEEPKQSEYAYKHDLGAASARFVVTPVHFQPALTLPHTVPRIDVSSIPSFTYRSKKRLPLAPGLPVTAVLKSRARFAGKLEAEPVNTEKLHFKRTTTLLAFDTTPPQKINALPPDPDTRAVCVAARPPR
ncbi:MAG: hypothetical protein HY074_12840 [Deltaproteobacteria bacterium]|nr:hypothetical protein [Deltaproteobacteria bacterium]